MSIKTNFEIPRAIDTVDVVKQGQRTAQDLSKNFKAIKKELDDINAQQSSYVSGINGLLFSSSYSVNAAAGATTSVTVTFNHAFNALPSGFIITDITSSNTVKLTAPAIIRDSWTNNSITVRIYVTNIDTVTSRVQSGDFKIIVLR